MFSLYVLTLIVLSPDSGYLPVITCMLSLDTCLLTPVCYHLTPASLTVDS